MYSEADEPLARVLGNYDLNVVDIRNESYKDKKGVWWIKTDDGMKILKKISNSEDTLKFILDAVFHLSKNGIHLPEVNKTADGRNYANIGGTCYTLTNAIEGRNPVYSSPQEMDMIAAELARFHKASANFSPKPGTKPKYHLGLWIEDYTNQLEDMNRFYKNEKSLRNNDSTGKAVIREFPYFYERAWKSIEGLRGPEYRQWVNKAEKTGCLCHQDFAAGNLIITASGTIYVLDTDSITIDIPARDIRKLLNKVMKKEGKWDIDLAKKILASYQAINPLTRSEWEVIRLDLTFPHLFLGAVNKYYYKRDKEWSMEKYLQRIVEMAAFEKTITSFLENFSKITPC